MNAYLISNVPIASGIPTDGQIIVYVDNQWVYAERRLALGGIPIIIPSPPTDGHGFKLTGNPPTWKIVNI